MTGWGMGRGSLELMTGVGRAREVWRRDVSTPEVIEGRDGGWDVSSQRVLVSKAWECGDETSPTPKSLWVWIGAGTSRPRKFWVARGGHGDGTSPLELTADGVEGGCRTSRGYCEMPPRHREGPHSISTAAAAALAWGRGVLPPRSSLKPEQVANLGTARRQARQRSYFCSRAFTLGRRANSANWR